MLLSDFLKLRPGDELFVDGILSKVIDVTDQLTTDRNLHAVTVSFFDEFSKSRKTITLYCMKNLSDDDRLNQTVLSRLTSFNPAYDV